MATISFEISDSAKDLLEQEVASGHFKHAGAVVEMLLTRFLWIRARNKVGGFSESEKQQIDRMLDEAVRSFELGEQTEVRPGEFEELAQRVADQARQRQAS